MLDFPSMRSPIRTNRSVEATMQTEVLAILRRRRGPLSALDVLGGVARGQSGNRAANLLPGVVRAVGAWARASRRVAERLHRLSVPPPPTCAILSICDYCGTVEESEAPDSLMELSSIIGKPGFAPMRHVVEVHGIRDSCGAGQAPA